MSKVREGVDLDGVLHELGECGRYQTTIYILIILPIVIGAIHNCQYIFSAGETNYRCQVPECESSVLVFETEEWGSWALPESGGRCSRLVPLGDTCAPESFHPNETQSCSSWVYESNNTIVAEFDLGCQEWRRTLVGTVHGAGVFVALGLTAYVSDTFGRRTAFILTAVSDGVVGVIRAFVNSYVLYIVLEFVEAIVGAGVYSTGFILALEMVGLNRRVLGGTIISCTFAIGQVIMALVAWAVPYWRTLTLIVYAPAILFVFYYFALEESVRWLLSKGRKKEAARIIFKAAAINRKKLCAATIKSLTEEQEDSKTVQDTAAPAPARNTKEPSIFFQVIRSKTLVSRVCVCSFWWITVTFIYYGLSINSVSLAGNSYVNYILTSLVEIPGYAISVVTLDRFGRKSSIITAFFICGIALIVLPFVPSNAIVIALSNIGKLSVSMVFASIYIYTIELFPTNCRHSLMNTCSMLGRVGSMSAPQTPLLMEYWVSLPYLVFGVMAGTSGLLMLLTPETLGIRLPDTVKQAENIDVAPRTRRQTDIIVD